MNSKGKSLFLILFILATTTVFGQKKVGDMRLGYGISGGITMNNYSGAVGIDGRFQYDITLKTSLIGTTGYTHFFSNELPDLAYVPAKVGFKSHIGEQVYVLGEIGAGFSTTGMGISPLWNPGIGIATKHIDISLRYENLQKFDTGQFALRLAYGYKL
ncbi:hypothetical protein EQG63_08850 [Flavobacterium amnicola]|uniref:Outer membrane protein beta-barrel domain-containing protein n=1 Tax=Flavobacterium amnicola TaxID=2506422 RepID=A0A4V1N1U9_9FLAO|nr:hypothetical protein [Flavobacterium amnicola]RXR18366.1 hypothetical protein EQG63_08850 [Flavobacterium amnicola]